MLNEIDLSRADLNLLVLFETVLEERNVGRAAERLNLSASAVSHGLGRLRRLLNDPLFLKTPKGVVPTERARELAAPIGDILARVRSVISTAEPFEPARSRRRFTIGTSDGFSVFLPPLLDEIARKAPSIDLVVRHMQMETAFSDLDGRLIDIAIAPFYELPARFAAQRLYEEEFVVAARSGHPFSKKPTLENYCRMQHLLVAPRGDPSGVVDELLASRGLSRRVALAVPNFLLALDLLTKTELVCVLPKRFVEMHAARFAVGTAKLPLDLGASNIQAVVPKSALMDVGLVWLLDVLGSDQQ
ncbi:MAG: LysR family transcriptional regulator [Sinorhizobium meliloti]|uniref:LysR family transcriptional regulator n=1 Tax=Sinorhizobium TaxID=28105 RepID=UPI00037E11D6|nr:MULTISPECIES: LysR family transcriptional regulator [Sinorhizobium]MCG5486945.1 LysR family transcriptional regulator [Sinorhizobium meliloti]PND20056.1 LysR family transcriptional regulator [Ensifer sp. MMN_5]PND25338.1 LysR family transcriptional regulator [Sinorhizobium sp. M4_45]RVQ01760.1 LysR family transcriptional regulator [Sinorhizobium meliloti]